MVSFLAVSLLAGENSISRGISTACCHSFGASTPSILISDSADFLGTKVSCAKPNILAKNKI